MAPSDQCSTISRYTLGVNRNTMYVLSTQPAGWLDVKLKDASTTEDTTVAYVLR